MTANKYKLFSYIDLSGTSLAIPKPLLSTASKLFCTSALFFTATQLAVAETIFPDPATRAQEAYELRLQEAQANLNETLATLPQHQDNGDEDAYSTAGPNPAEDKYYRINSYTKGLAHNQYGVVIPESYQGLLNALESGDDADFEAIPMTKDNCPVDASFCLAELKLRNPQAAYSYFIEGKDAHAYTFPAAPSFDSNYQAAEAIEVLWQALTRDVPFSEYESDELIQQAAADMSRFTEFAGPKDGEAVTPGTLFRGIGPGETVGPYISQFLLKPIPYGATTVEQKYNVPKAGNDHLTNYNEWLRIQRGGRASGITSVDFQPQHKHLYNGRALAQYVLQDFVNQAYLGAARIIRQYGSAAYDPNDPYKGSATQARSPLFGNNHAVDLLTRVAMGSQNVAWFQKWLVHRRARPEVFFGRVHNHLVPDNGISYFSANNELLASAALDLTYEANGTYLLPTATPVGSPLHPTYPAGHAVMAGAAVTMLKAFFNGDFVIPDPVMPSKNGDKLIAYEGTDLTIESELNKLASNISLGRDTAGVHYRTDGDIGIALGEQYAISVLEELVETYNEDFAGFTFNKFDGTPMTIAKKP